MPVLVMAPLTSATMGEQWPSLRGRRMRAILERLCGDPVRREGSHCTFRSPKTGELFTFAYHDNREIRGHMVRRILVVDVGLKTEEARREAR
ncbi:type II toxin-antitoxin system HicA family toxin [Pseudonocardia alaniniphila]|uniref:type II toxin-antitoxin system HicA family toxin n=2 Tax=Pseudonocardia alaniniphila TaxID=75291 RepID=UPI003B84A5AB